MTEPTDSDVAAFPVLPFDSGDDNGHNDDCSLGSAQVAGDSKHAMHHSSIARMHTIVRQDNHVGPDARAKLHIDATQRLELADRAQQAYFLAYELECEMADLALWTEAMIIPQSWRLAIRRHVAPLLRRMKLNVANLIQAESMLLPPFHPGKVGQFERLLQSTEDVSVVLYDTIQECKRRASDGEQVVAASMIQLHVRRRLRAKGFYTTIVKLTRLQRGLIPGLFDGLKGETIMNITADSITLEYPKALNQTAARTPVRSKNGGRPSQ